MGADIGIPASAASGTASSTPVLDFPRVMPVGTDALAQPRWLPVGGVLAIRCFHQLANLFWAKAKSHGFSAVAARNSDSALSWVYDAQFRVRGAVGPAPKTLPSGIAPASSPWSLGAMAELRSPCLVHLGRRWGAIPQTGLLPQPSSLCGNL